MGRSGGMELDSANEMVDEVEEQDGEGGVGQVEMEHDDVYEGLDEGGDEDGGDPWAASAAAAAASRADARAHRFFRNPGASEVFNVAFSSLLACAVSARGASTSSSMGIAEFDALISASSSGPPRSSFLTRKALGIVQPRYKLHNPICTYSQ